MIIYLIIINVITFVIFGLDKRFAINHSFRISENNLFLLSTLGGFLGSILGMKIFHHKTRKLSFYAMNILSLFFWLYIFLYFS